eukprot:2249014-Rhodomonas_salina.1
MPCGCVLHRFCRPTARTCEDTHSSRVRCWLTLTSGVSAIQICQFHMVSLSASQATPCNAFLDELVANCPLLLLHSQRFFWDTHRELIVSPLSTDIAVAIGTASLWGMQVQHGVGTQRHACVAEMSQARMQWLVAKNAMAPIPAIWEAGFHPRSGLTEIAEYKLVQLCSTG